MIIEFDESTPLHVIKELAPGLRLEDKTVELSIPELEEASKVKFSVDFGQDPVSFVVLSYNDVPLDAEQTQVVVVEIDEDQPAQVVQVDGLDELDIDFDGPLPKLYGLRVEVMIEVRQQPSQFITNSATSDVLRNLEEVPIELAERNIPAMYWQPVGRDVLLENRLIAAIIRRASELTDLDQYNFIQP